MAESVFRGPVVSLGSLMDGRVEPFDGPTVSYQAGAIPDPRYSPAPKDGISVGRVWAFMNLWDTVVVDNIPQKAATSAIGTAQLATTGTNVTLNATTLTATLAGAPIYATNIPIIPFGQASVTTVLALDFGFSTGTTTANSSTVVVTDSTLYQAGQWLVIGGAGNAGNTTPLITQVQTTVNATTIRISPVAVGTLTNAPIGQGNAYGGFPSQAVASAAEPYIQAGLAKVFDPRQAIARNISIQGNTTNATTAFLVNGYDVYGNAMSELITTSGTTIIYGKKAFKYIKNIQPQTTNTIATYQFGFGDSFGFHFRATEWESTNVMWNGAAATNTNGFTAAAPGPATASTGDVRGTIQISTAGPLGTSVVAPITNGTGRLVMYFSPTPANILAATPTNYSSLFGTGQA